MSPVRCLPVNSFPWHPRGQISVKLCEHGTTATAAPPPWRSESQPGEHLSWVCHPAPWGGDGCSLYIFVHSSEFSLLVTSQFLVPRSCLVTDSHIKLPLCDLWCGFSLMTGPRLRHSPPAACGYHVLGPERIVSET